MLKGKIIIVTGTSSGIGKGCAEVLSRNGATVLGLDKESPANNGFTQYTVDVRDENSIIQTLDSIVTEFSRIDGLVNCAGIFSQKKPFYEISLEEWNQVIATNLTGTFLMAKYVSPIMCKQKKGKIVNISCIRSRLVNSHMAEYAASKGGVVALTSAMAMDLAPYNIQVNSVAPGITYTGITEKTYRDEEKRKKRESMIPAGKIAEPEDIANVVLFLLSDLANYITGETIFADGGFTVFK